jgi:2-C-methyl-D-erythritol 4-phosphate cytidylyltransferase
MLRGNPSLSKKIQVAAVLPAAGVGKRMAAGGNKALLPLAGQPMLLRAAAALVESGLLEALTVVVGAEELEMVADLFAGFPLPVAVVPGGAERADSVRAGLEWLASWTGWRRGARHFVAIHDAARPLLTQGLFARILAAAVETGAAIPGLPVVDTLKRAGEDGLIQATVERAGLWQAQTPQVFEFEGILAAHKAARGSGAAITDDARLWEMTGRPIRIVPGERTNFKITAREDLALAEVLLQMRVP